MYPHFTMVDVHIIDATQQEKVRLAAWTARGIIRLMLPPGSYPPFGFWDWLNQNPNQPEVVLIGDPPTVNAWKKGGWGHL